MNSVYRTSDTYCSAALAVDLEMDMEVKSEPDSDDEFCDSSVSVTSSVEEIPVATTSTECQSEDEELEEEPLVEIDSVSVPQEIVEVALEPSLLLFVNRDPKTYTPAKSSESTTGPTETSIKENSVNKTAEEELANRKSITKALRNIKRKRNFLDKQPVESIINGFVPEVPNGKSIVNCDNDPKYFDEPPSPCHSSSDVSLGKADTPPLPPSRRIKNATKQRTNKKVCVENTNKSDQTENYWNDILPHSLSDDVLQSSDRKRRKKSSFKINSNSRRNENSTKSCDKDLKMKENVLNNENIETRIPNLHSKDVESKIRNVKEKTKRNKCFNKLRDNVKSQKISNIKKKLERNKGSKISKNSKSKPSEKEVMELVGKVKPDSFDCTVCGKKFREKSHLATHSRAHVDIRNFKCNECGHLFKTKTNLFFHMKTHEEAPFICEKCNKIYAERKMLMRHIRVVHSGEGNYNCDQCGRSFKSAHNLDLHNTLHTGNKPFSCNVCGKSFVYKSTYTAHMKAHEADDLFSCDLCPADVLNKGELRRRCNHFSEARPWLCTVCGKGYPLKGTLKNHMKTHEPDKPFKCNDCGKTFMKKQSYECHMKMHAGENPQYMCDQCSQSYFNVFALKRHYMKHTSERKFVCDICNKAFWMKDALKVHKRSHASVKMFHCTQCLKTFAHKHTLVAHLRSHSCEQSFSCTSCPKTFIHKYNLDRHERQHAVPLMPPPPTSFPLPPSLIMMAPPKQIDLPTLHIL